MGRGASRAASGQPRSDPERLEECMGVNVPGMALQTSRGSTPIPSYP